MSTLSEATVKDEYQR